MAKTIDDVRADNAKTRLSRAKDIMLDHKIEEHFKTTQRTALPGRNVFFNRMRYLNNKKYKDNFANTFPDAPGNDF